MFTLQHPGPHDCSNLLSPNVQAHWPLHHINTTLAQTMAPQADRCCNVGFYMAMWIVSFNLQRAYNGSHPIVYRPCQTFICWLEHFSQHWRSQRSLFTCLDLLAEALVLLQSLCFLHQWGLTLLKLLTCVFTSRLCNHKFFCSVKSPLETFFSPVLQQNILLLDFFNGSRNRTSQHIALESS